MKEMTDNFTLTGSYFEVGKELGKRTKEAVQRILEEFKNSTLFGLISSYLNTEEGSHLLATFKKTVKRYCGNCLDELSGIAEGAGVDIDDLFLFNCECEFAAMLGLYPEGSHGVPYASLYDGCTNISMETDDCKVYLAHTEDISPVAKDLGVMLTVEIKQDNGNIDESWTDYVVPGMLGGSKFFFNSYGIMCGANNILQKGVNINGIPRKFMCRSLLNVWDASQAVEILQQNPGIATAYCFHYMQKTATGIENTVIEAAGSQAGSHVITFKPRGFYHHCNMFQHLHYECHPEESSIHRAAVLSQYVNRGQTRTKEDLLSVLSNRQDAKFPVYRSGAAPDYLATGATGVFDVTDGNLEVYTDVPERTKPKYVFKVPCT